MPTEDHISALERLAKLKADGAISDTDFEAQKARLMGSSTADHPLTQPKKHWRTIALVVAAIWAVALLAKAIFYPGDWGTDDGPKSTQTVQAAAAPTASQVQPALAQMKGASTAQPNPSADTASDSGVPACTDPKVRQMAMDGMQVAFDKMGMPFEPTMKTALGNLEEKDSDEAARLKRILTNPTDGHFKLDEVRMCQGAGPELDYLGLTAVIQHDGKLGGYVLISGLRAPVPFGDSFD